MENLLPLDQHSDTRKLFTAEWASQSRGRGSEFTMYLGAYRDVAMAVPYTTLSLAYSNTVQYASLKNASSNFKPFVGQGLFFTHTALGESCANSTFQR